MKDIVKAISRTPSVIKIQVITPPAKSKPPIAPRFPFKLLSDNLSGFASAPRAAVRAMPILIMAANVYIMPEEMSITLNP